MSKPAHVKTSRAPQARQQTPIKRSHAIQPPASRTDVLRREARRWGLPAAGLLVAALVVAIASSQPDNSASAGAGAGNGSAPARISRGPAPAFTAQDVLTGQPITSAGLRGKNVLLFFSEGVMCQACFEQIQSLQNSAGQLRNRGLTLVSVTTDPPNVLRQAVQQNAITTPMISDTTGQMSTAYGAIGQGMHPSTDGHTFVLINPAGRIVWRHDYTTMYVPPNQLLAAIPSSQSQKG